MANVNATIDFKVLKALMLFAGKSDIRYYLNGLHIEQSATGTVAVATNGHVIAIARIDSDCMAISGHRQRAGSTLLDVQAIQVKAYVALAGE
jgi:hypothetical protein